MYALLPLKAAVACGGKTESFSYVSIRDLTGRKVDFAINFDALPFSLSSLKANPSGEATAAVVVAAKATTSSSKGRWRYHYTEKNAIFHSYELISESPSVPRVASFRWFGGPFVPPSALSSVYQTASSFFRSHTDLRPIQAFNSGCYYVCNREGERNSLK